MNRTIFKYSIPADGVVSIPKGAKILKVGHQNNNLFMWALVDPLEDKVNRKFKVYGTGWNMPLNPGVFIGTVLTDSFVWHIFEEIV